MAYTIKKALEEKRQGYFIGQRLVLPFKCQILKIIFDNEIFTELVGGKHIKLNQDPQNTSIYITSHGKLSNYVNSYSFIKLIVCEMEDDICDISKHVKLICEILDNHHVNIHLPGDDMIFIE
jgi:hypothetical protein